MELSILKDIVIIFGISVVVLYICHRIGIPSVVGFLLTGILVGPSGLALIEASHEVETFAEIGVVLLLFAIGIEFSIDKLLQIKKAVLIGGSLQVAITSLLTMALARAIGFSNTTGESIFTGFLVALSSTAIVLKLLQERAEVDSPHGGTTLGILIFQDIVIVPMILVTPILAGVTANLGSSLLLLLAKGLGIIVLVMISARWIVPQLLFQIVKTRNQEIFLLSIVVICFGVAWLTSKAGLSLALGAFMAGLIISESEYSHHALGNILPFKDVFTTFFFVSIGMMLDLDFFIKNPVVILSTTLGVLVLKTMIAMIVTVILGFPLRTGILVGLALCQIGEFSFILSRVGIEYNLLSPETYQRFLSITILSMALTPFIISLAPVLANASTRLPLPRRLATGIYPATPLETQKMKDHLIIVGFGVNGRNVARAAKAAGIPYTIIEMNPETVRREQASGEPIHYGDATREHTLKHANIHAARIVVVAINDPTATRRITELVKRLNPHVHLIVRTRYIQEMQPLYELGANEVIPEEFETSVEIFTRVLAKYLVPREEIERLVSIIRADGYRMFRSLSQTPVYFTDLKLHLPEIEVTTLKLHKDSPLAGHTLAQTELRKRYGISVVAIQRGSQVISNPDADMILEPDDILYILGPCERISKAVKELSPQHSHLYKCS